MSSYPSEKQAQDINDGGSWEQNDSKGKVGESEVQSEERPRNVNRGSGGDRRGYGGGNRGFRGHESRSYDRQDGRNNRRDEVSNDSDAKENRGGDIGNAVQVNNYSAGAERYALSTNDIYCWCVLLSMCSVIVLTWFKFFISVCTIC